MPIINELQNYSSCSIWLEGFKSRSTKKAYSIHLSLFCKYCALTPDQLIKLESGKLKTLLFNYIINLKKTAKQNATKPKLGHLSVNSIKYYITGIQSFLEFHEIVLPWKKIAKFYPEDVTNSYRAYTKEEIAKLLSLTDLRDRCIILLMAASGVRVGAIPSLRISSLLRLEEGVGFLTVYPGTKHSYVTLVTSEFLTTIEEYLNFRRRRGEHIVAESPLIRDKFNLFGKTTNKARGISEGAINKQMRILLIKAGLPSDQLQPNHSFRKFFNSCLLNSDVSYTFKELMMGHSVNLDRFYYDKNSQTSRKKILLEYLKAIDALTIDESYRLKKKIVEYEEKIKDAPRVEQLQAQLANRIIEEEYIKMQLKKLQSEKESETLEISTKYEKDMNIMKEQMALQNEKINRLLSVIVKEGKDGETAFGKEVFEYLTKDPEKNRLFFSTVNCDYNDEIIYDAAAKDLLPVKKVLEEKASNSSRD
jgi:integrase